MLEDTELSVCFLDWFGNFSLNMQNIDSICYSDNFIINVEQISEWNGFVIFLENITFWA